MAMLSLEKAAAKIISELELKPYSVTPALLCEWTRTSKGKVVAVQLPFAGLATNDQGMEVTIPSGRYFELSSESLFELEMKDSVRITTLFQGDEHFSIDPPLQTHIHQLKIDSKNIAQLIETSKSLERRPMQLRHENLTVADEIFSEIADSTIHGAPVTSSQFPAPASHAEPAAMQAERQTPTDVAVEDDNSVWPLYEPEEADTLTKAIYGVLKEKHDLSEPLPPVRDVMSLCKIQNKYGILFIANELKYLDGQGRLQTANAENVLKRISTMTHPGLFRH